MDSRQAGESDKSTYPQLLAEPANDHAGAGLSGGRGGTHHPHLLAITLAIAGLVIGWTTVRRSTIVEN